MISLFWKVLDGCFFFLIFKASDYVWTRIPFCRSENAIIQLLEKILVQCVEFNREAPEDANSDPGSPDLDRLDIHLGTGKLVIPYLGDFDDYDEQAKRWVI